MEDSDSVTNMGDSETSGIFDFSIHLHLLKSSNKMCVKNGAIRTTTYFTNFPSLQVERLYFHTFGGV
jgi:hypothetical protein